MRWTRERVRRTRFLSRTQKPCGPDTPTLVSSWREMILLMTGQTSPVPEEGAEDGVKTIAQGMPDVLAEPVVTAASFLFFWRATGAVSTRHSLRPLRFQRVVRSHDSGANCAARTRTRILDQLFDRSNLQPGRHCEAPERRLCPPSPSGRRRKQSRVPGSAIDCFASLAMTKAVTHA
jgi:hypothetical protein